MTINEFHRELGRLEKHFRLNEDDRDDITRDWFKALKHYHVEALSTAIDQVIQEATDTFWPALGRITSAIKSRMSKYETTRRECLTCKGRTWIEAIPWKSNGLLYEGFIRCPDCGIPPPNYTPPSNREELTATEYAQYLSGSLPQPEMYIARSHPLVKQALDLLGRPPAIKAIAQTVDVAKAIREPGEEG